MADSTKEFNELLLHNLSTLSAKVDNIQTGMSEIKSDVAVLKETKRTVEVLNSCIDKFEEKMSSLDKDLAIKSSKWGVISSLITLLIALLIALMAGLFKPPAAANNDTEPFHTRGGNKTQVDTIN